MVVLGWTQGVHRAGVGGRVSDEVEIGELARILGRPVAELQAWMTAQSLADAGLDSIELLELVVIVEDGYGIEFPGELLDSIDSFTELLHWIGVLRTNGSTDAWS